MLAYICISTVFCSCPILFFFFFLLFHYLSVNFFSFSEAFDFVLFPRVFGIPILRISHPTHFILPIPGFRFSFSCPFCLLSSLFLSPRPVVPAYYFLVLPICILPSFFVFSFFTLFFPFPPHCLTVYCHDRQHTPFCALHLLVLTFTAVLCTISHFAKNPRMIDLY